MGFFSKILEKLVIGSANASANPDPQGAILGLNAACQFGFSV